MPYLARIERALSRITAALCVFGGLGLGFAVLAICWSALAKLGARTLNAAMGPENIPQALSWIKPLGGEKEIVAFAVGFAIFAALPLMTLQRGHIRIDLFINVLGAGVNRLLNLAADLILLILAYIFVRQHWNAIFKPARNNARIQEDSLLELIFAGDWATVWGQRFLDDQQTQVAALKFWPWHIWAEVCSLLFLAVAAFVCGKSLVELFKGFSSRGQGHD